MQGTVDINQQTILSLELRVKAMKAQLIIYSYCSDFQYPFMELRNSLKMYTSYIYTENSFLVFILKESLSGIYKLILYLFPVTRYQ